MSNSEERRYEFKFSKMQIVLLFAGIGVMAAVMFSLGTVVGKSLGEINTIVSKPAPNNPPPAEVAQQAAPPQPSPQVEPPHPVAPATPQETVPASPVPPQPVIPVPEPAKALHEPPAATPAEKPAAGQAEEKTAPAKAEKAAKEEPQAKAEAEKHVKKPGRTVKKPVAKPATAKATKLTAGTDTPPKAYLLQAGSFAGRAEADQLAKKLRRNGFKATVTPIEIESKGTWYRVRTGPYPTRQTAEKNLQKLQQINGLTPLLITAN